MTTAEEVEEEEEEALRLRAERKRDVMATMNPTRMSELEILRQ
jgi:hypothetical protein